MSRRTPPSPSPRPEAQEVARRIREGTYQVDLERLAERLLDELDPEQAPTEDSDE